MTEATPPAHFSIGERHRYQKLWFYAVFSVSFLALAPLLLVTFVNLHENQKALQKEILLPVSRLLANTQRALEFVIAERKNALSFLINERAMEDLRDENRLMTTYQNLSNAFGGFVDLGVIDAQGEQLVYVGPYDLKDRNYKDQAWFHEICLRNVYISDVFMGYRNFPHFVIAVRHTQADGSFYILRATFDMQLLNEQILPLKLGPSSDVFIVNKEGILQTNSRFHGKILEPCTGLEQRFIAEPQGETIQEFEENGASYFIGSAVIENSPFMLTIVQNQKDLMSNWETVRKNPIWFLVGSSLFILGVVLAGATYTVRQIRRADQRRAKAFHNLEYTNKMASIGRLAASVAHEINNPLAIINEKAGLLQDQVAQWEPFPQRPKVEGLLHSILSSVERCSTITHRLLGFARRLEGHTELIDLEILLKEVLSFLSHELQLHKVSTHFEIPRLLPPIESDRGLLQQVFLNIINNAQAALTEGGWIKFILEPAPLDSISVKICDNGSGIASQDLKHIFEPFFSTKGEFGTGLGLSITYDIITRLGGHIEVSSELGKGTCFALTLPRKKR